MTDSDSEADPDDLYKLLGVPSHATTAQIAKAYRKEARKYHPDKNQNNPAAGKNSMPLMMFYGQFFTQTLFFS
jgi:DnaJ-domain-containing protein 1